MTFGLSTVSNKTQTYSNLYSQANIFELGYNSSNSVFGNSSFDTSSFDTSSSIFDTTSLSNSGTSNVFDTSSTSYTSVGTGSGKATGQLSKLINKVASKVGVDAKLLSALVKQESSYNPNAVSPCGAGGLCQLMPATAKSLGCKNVYDPEQNLMAGARYLKAHLKKFGSIELALAAYNAGGGAVEKYGGIPPYAETQDYVAKIMKTYNQG